MIILVTGTPGVGKTSFASLLAKRLKGIHIDASKLALTEGLVLNYDAKRKTYVADLRRLSKRLARMVEAAGENPVVISSHYVSGIISPEAVSLVFILRLNPLKLLKRLKARAWPMAKVKENVQAEILDVCLTEAADAIGLKKVCQIDTSFRPASKWVDEALKVIRGEKAPFIIWVDWLGFLAEKKALLRFLS